MKVGDSGQYRCRVDYDTSPTRNTRIKLKLVGEHCEQLWKLIQQFKLGHLDFRMLHVEMHFLCFSAAHPPCDLQRGGAADPAAHQPGPGGHRPQAVLQQRGRGPRPQPRMAQGRGASTCSGPGGGQAVRRGHHLARQILL